MPGGMTGRNVGGGTPGKVPPVSKRSDVANTQVNLPAGVNAKDIKPHAIVTKPNGMGRLAGGPRGHRELPRPIIPTPTQGGRRVG